MSRFQRHMMKASGNRINFAGKFSDDSTPDDWWWKPNGVKESIAEYVDPETKEFAFHWEGKLSSAEGLLRDSKIESIYHIPDLSKVSTMHDMFKGCVNLKKVRFPHTRFVSLNSIINLFCDCCVIEHIDISPLNFGDNEIRMQAVFARCYCLKQVDISNIEFKNMRDPSLFYLNDNQLTHIRLRRSVYNFAISHGMYPPPFKDGAGIWEIVD